MNELHQDLTPNQAANQNAELKQRVLLGKYRGLKTEQRALDESKLFAEKNGDTLRTAALAMAALDGVQINYPNSMKIAEQDPMTAIVSSERISDDTSGEDVFYKDGSMNTEINIPAKVDLERGKFSLYEPSNTIGISTSNQEGERAITVFSGGMKVRYDIDATGKKVTAKVSQTTPEYIDSLTLRPLQIKSESHRFDGMKIDKISVLGGIGNPNDTAEGAMNPLYKATQLIQMHNKKHLIAQ